MMATPTTCACGKATLPDDVRAFAQERVGRDRARGFLIPTLHRLQHVVGYLRDDHMAEIADMFGMSANEVKGVASFYHFFTFKPRGRFPIAVCTGTACHVRGAAAVMDKIKATLGIQEGGQTADGLFSLGSARCLGMCALAPVVMVGDKVYGGVTPDDVPEMLKKHGFKG